VNAEDSSEYGQRYRPLHYAAYQGHLPLCQLLVQQGAKVNPKKIKQSPYYLSIMFGTESRSRLTDASPSMPLLPPTLVQEMSGIELMCMWLCM
jgi:hypothetical protein